MSAAIFKQPEVVERSPCASPSLRVANGRVSRGAASIAENSRRAALALREGWRAGANARTVAAARDALHARLEARGTLSPTDTPATPTLSQSEQLPDEPLSEMVVPNDDKVDSADAPIAVVTDDDKSCFEVVRQRLREDDTRRGEAVLRPIASVGFDMLPEAEIVLQSTVRVTQPESFLPIVGGKIVAAPNGPLAPAMGPFDGSTSCETCGGVHNYDYTLAPNPTGVYPCPGHFGHILLPGAVFAVPFTNSLYSVIQHMLRCICWTCGEMPASAKKRATTIATALRCTPAGTPLNRDRRLAIVCKAMQSEVQCHTCRSRIRCSECADSEAQCDTCAKQIEFRPAIRNRTKGSRGAASFTDFPLVVTWGVDTMTAERRAQFAAFKRRHPAITVTELSFNPERARRMWSVVGPEVALLLAPTLPRGPYRATGDIYTRVFGEKSPAALHDLKLTAVRAARDLFETMVTRVIPVIPPTARPTRGTELNEMTKVYKSIIETANATAAAAAALTTLSDASPPLQAPTSPRSIARGHGTSRHPDPHSAIEREAVLRHAPGAPWYAPTRADHHLVATHYGTLQYYTALLVDPSQALKFLPSGSSAPRPNSTKPGAESTKDKAHAVVTNLKGKNGRLRENLTGKRVDFSMRTVITPDPDLDIDELALPYWVAARMTLTDTITDYNYKTLLDAAELRRVTVQRVAALCAAHRVDHLRDLPIRVRDRLATDASLDQEVLRMGGMLTLYIWTADGTQKYDYTKMSTPVHQHAVARCAGTRIDRPPRQGDVVAWNRAPSLHLVSFMAHTIVLYEKRAASINPGVTTPYNADFDGDEMNGHFIQCLGARAEGSVLMPPSANMLLPRTSSPIIAMVQDMLLGAFDMSLPHTMYTYAEVCDYLLVAQNSRMTTEQADPYGDAKNLYRLPPPAISVAERGRCDKSCHFVHVYEKQTCATPCREHDADCAARPRWTRYWTGLQVISMFLPRWFSASKTPILDPQQLGFRVNGRPLSDKQRAAVRNGDIPWSVRDGDLLYGSLNKSAVGIAHRNIMHHLLMTTGVQSIDDSTGKMPERTRIAMTYFYRALGKMAVHNLTHRGFSTGLSDAVVESQRTKAQIALAIYGVKPPVVPSDEELMALVYSGEARSVFAAKRAIDPVRFNTPTYDLTEDDARAVPLDVLDKYKIAHEVQQPGIERIVAALIQDHYARERAGAKDDVERAFSPLQRVQRLEAKIRAACEAVRDKAHAAVFAEITLANRLFMMTCAGSKGSLINIGSIMACVGPQSSGGRRLCDHDIALGDEGDTAEGAGNASLNPSIRWYPHTPARVMQGATAGGMVKTGYIDGCRPHDFVSQFWGGREGLVDTAVKTAETGYLQRRIIKTLEGDRMAADGTVRNEGNRIVAHWPSGVRVDTRFLMSTTCDALVLPRAEFHRAALIGDTDADRELIRLCSHDAEAAADAAAREWIRVTKALAAVRQLPDYDNTGGRIRVVNDLTLILGDAMRQSGFGSLLTNAESGYTSPATTPITEQWRTAIRVQTEARGQTLLTIERAVELVEAWLAHPEVAKHDSVTLTHASTLLTAKQLIVRYQMPTEILSEALDRYTRALIFSRAQTGDACGVLTAEELGEPLTQLMLRTFYVAGREAPVTRGVPRFSEIVATRSAASMKTPMVEGHFDMVRINAELAAEQRKHSASSTGLGAHSRWHNENDRLDAALASAHQHVPVEKATARKHLSAVLQAVRCVADAQYSWTLDTVFTQWTHCTSSANVFGLALDNESVQSAARIAQQAAVKTVLVGRVSVEFAARLASDTTALDVDEAQAFYAAIATDIAAAVVPATGVDVRFICAPLLVANAPAAFAFIAFGATGARAQSAYNDVRQRASKIPVLYSPPPVDVAVVSAALCIDAWATVDAAAAQTHIDRDAAAEHRVWLERSMLAPIRSSLPQIALREIVDLAAIEYAPLENVSGLRQRSPLVDANDDEQLASELFYDHGTFHGGCRRPECRNASDMPNGYSHSDPSTYCLGSLVLVLRLNALWFSLTRFDPEIVRNRIAAYLGEDRFSVFVGDASSRDYIALHIRLHTCRLDEIAAHTYSMSALDSRVKRGQFMPTPPVVVRTEEMLTEGEARERERWAVIDDRNDIELRPLNDLSYVREMRISLGFVESPDPLQSASLLINDLCAEIRHETARVRGLLAKSTPSCPRVARRAHPIHCAKCSALTAFVKWTAAISDFCATNLPAPDRNRPRLNLPVGFVPPVEWVSVPDAGLFTKLGAWLHECAAFVDAHTPLWCVGAGRRASLPQRPPPPEHLRAELVTDIRAHLARSSASRRGTQVEAVTYEDIVDERVALRTQVETNELTRLLGILQSFVFTGKTAITMVQTHASSEVVYSPDYGIERVDRTVADIATTDFMTTMAFPTLDQTRTSTNSVLDVARVLGIEAARAAFIIQYADVFQITGPHAASNHANISLLANVQTSQGVCLPVTRQGVKDIVEDALQQASYEQAPMVFAHACIARSQIPKILSPSSAMMLALPIPGFGTSAIDLILDPIAMINNACVVPPIEDTIENVYPLNDARELTLPSLANCAMSPLISFSDEVYETDHYVPPTHSEMASEMRDLGIEQHGSFSPRENSPEPEKDMSPPPPVVPRIRKELRERVGLLAKRARVLGTSSVVAYDPTRPTYDTREVYDPLAAKRHSYK